MAYGQVQEADLVAKSIEARPLTLTERLRDEKANLQKRLSEINGVLDKLEKQPELAAVLDDIARLGHLHY